MKSRKWFYPVICRSSRVMVKSYSMSICREIVKLQHVHLPWNCQIAARRDIVESSNRQITAWAICREIFKLQHRTKDVNCTFDPSPASTRQTTNSSVNDFQIERRFDAAPISMIRGLPPCADSNHVRRIVSWNDSASFPPRAERQIRRCKRFSDWNDSPPRLPAPISTIRGLPPPRAKWSCVRFSGWGESWIEAIRPRSPHAHSRSCDLGHLPWKCGLARSCCLGHLPWKCGLARFLGFRIYFRWCAFGESRQNIICFGVEWIFGDVLLVSRAKTYYVWI